MELNEHCTDFSCTLDCNPMAVVIGHLHEMHALEASLRERASAAIARSRAMTAERAKLREERELLWHQYELAGVPHWRTALAEAEARAERAEKKTEQVVEAMEYRAVIEQAKGIIMFRMGCSDAEAFAVLRDTSQRFNRKLRDIAALIVVDGQEAAIERHRKVITTPS